MKSGDTVDRVKFYSNSDMTTAYNFNKAIEVSKSITDKDYTINEILEFYNILKIFNPEYLKYQNEDIRDNCIKTSKQINKMIGKFCYNIDENNIEEYLNDVEFNYVEDFFEIIDKYKIYKRISKEKISDLLDKKTSYLHIILHNKNVVFVYDEIIREKLLKNRDSAELLLDEFEVDHSGNYIPRTFPKSLTNEDKNIILVNYINSEFANLNYLRLIVNLQATNELNVYDKTKLLAKRKAEEQEKKLFENNPGIEMSTLVLFKENLKETVEYNIKDQNWEFSYDINWIKENKNDNSTLLNNFIYLFEYVDRQMRWNLVSNINSMGVFERDIFMRSKRDYHIGAAFNRLNQLADIQMYGYCVQLQKLNVRIEDVLEWFFNYYLVKEFNIENYNISFPSKDSNNLEKCRTILPEIDSCLKQFNYLVEDGKIDPELLQISSTHLFFKDVKSLLKNKYVYSNGREYDLITYYFFSDQCMLSYVEKKKKSYKNFYELLLTEKIKKEEVVKYEQSSLKKLIDDNYIYIDDDGYIRIKNIVQITILYDLYNNDVISYWKLNEKQRKEIDVLVEKGLLRFESTLFSKPEQDYLNYYLNKSEFINSLDLRNMYGHGTQPFGNEDIHHSNYIRFLKLFVLIIIKINDELCIKDELIDEQTI